MRKNQVEFSVGGDSQRILIKRLAAVRFVTRNLETDVSLHLHIRFSDFLNLPGLFLLLFVFTSALPAAAQDDQPASSPKVKIPYKPRKLMRPLPAIRNAPMLKADEVTDQVTGNELVLGVVVNGKSRAYPINMLTGPRREIINDELGGTAIAATW